MLSISLSPRLRFPSRHLWLWFMGFALAVVSLQAAAQPAPPAPSASSTDATLAAARFDVFEYRVEGNTVLPPERIERAVVPFLGEKRTVADVEAARLALETAYRDAGYGTVLVDIPEQRVNSGVVVLQVLQTPVSRLRVIGAKYYSQGRILDKVPALAEGTVPNFKVVSEQLASVNRSADRRVTPLLRPGKLPGTTEVDLTVQDQSPLHGSLELNNKYSANTTKTRLQASLRYDNLWQLEHSLGVQAQVSPQDTSEVKVISASYTVPMGTGLMVLSAIRSNSSTVAGVGDTAVFGRGSIYGLRRMFIDGSETRTQSVTLGADYKDFSETVTVGGAEGFSTPIRYLPLNASYSTTLMDKDGSSSQAGIGVVLALRGLASRQSEFDDKRFLAQNNFSILKFDLARTHKLSRGLVLSGKLDGQVSSQPLISNEQFVGGGVDSVRGYLEASAVGDKGLRLSFELRGPNFMADDKGLLADLRAHAFFEGAGLWLKSPLPGQDARAGLLSTGFGLRMRARRYGSLGLDLGWPLRDAGQTEKGSARLHASGTLEF
ncbi:MAG: ShlB/FhaC/HecB family hemolysin secretion/activation protein [Cytophagales bacterium]|nr:ShlB/FhaC/HecB family hemolysin secretion/activation protein [Rhizobacter sp.]